MKQRYENIVVRSARESIGSRKIRVPCRMHYIFGETNANRDYSNVVAFAVKTIEDGLQKCGMLIDDNQRCVLPYTFSFVKLNRTDTPYIIVQIYEENELDCFAVKITKKGVIYETQ